MKTARSLALCIAAALPFSLASAQVYQWKDGSGRTVISDTPPPASIKANRAASTAAEAADGAGAAPKTMAEKEMEFRRRQQEARQKAEKEAQERQAAADRRESCQRARQSLAALESGEQLMIRDENGERRLMEDAQRQQEAERARRILAETCR